jgi:hypothetical protein
VAVIAALYPLWGTVLTGIFLLHVDGIVSTRELVQFLLAWLAIAAIEERVFRIPLGRHILGAVLLSCCWFVFLRHQWHNNVGPVVFVTQTVSRAAAIAFVWASRPASEGMGLARKLTTVSAAIAIASGGVAAFSWGIRSATLMLLACFLIIRVIRERYYRSVGGITPTALSITQRTTELSTLLVATFVQSLWHIT